MQSKQKMLDSISIYSSLKTKIIAKDHTILDEIQSLEQMPCEKHVVLDIINQIVVTCSNALDKEMSDLATEVIKKLQIEEEIPYCVLLQIPFASYETDINVKRAFVETQLALDVSNLTENQKEKYIYMYNNLALLTIYGDLNDLTERILEKVRGM